MSPFSEDFAYPRLGQVALPIYFYGCLVLIAVEELCKAHQTSATFLDLRKT